MSQARVNSFSLTGRFDNGQALPLPKTSSRVFDVAMDGFVERTPATIVVRVVRGISGSKWSRRDIKESEHPDLFLRQARIPMMAVSYIACSIIS